MTHPRVSFVLLSAALPALAAFALMLPLTAQALPPDWPAATHQTATGDWQELLPEGIDWSFDFANEAILVSAVVATGQLFVLEHTPDLSEPFQAADHLVGDDSRHEDFTVYPARWGVEMNFARFAISPMTGDYDADGITNAAELQAGLDPTASADTDEDALPDDWERFYFGDLSRDGSGDFDDDGLLDQFENQSATDPSVDQASLSETIKDVYAYDDRGWLNRFQLMSASSTSLTHDAEGNLTAQN